MLFRTKLLTTAAVVAFSATFAQADGHSEATAETVLATVNGTEITLGELIATATQLPEQYQQLSDDDLFTGLLNQLIRQQLLSDTLEEQPTRVDITMKNQLRSLRAGEVVTEVYQAPVDEAALQAMYDETYGNIEPVTEYNASHVLVETEDEALNVKELIDDGADFAETAREFSTGPSGPSGGELGWFGSGMMVAEFEEAVVAMETGGVSEPVNTQFGWHIIKLNETRETEVPTLEDVRANLTDTIMQDVVAAFVADLEASADVTRPDEGEFDPSLIRDVELLED